MPQSNAPAASPSSAALASRRRPTIGGRSLVPLAGVVVLTASGLAGCRTSPGAGDGAMADVAAPVGSIAMRPARPHRPVTPAVLDRPMDPAGRRPADIGPPPPGHPRIIGDVVPNWSAEAVFGDALRQLPEGPDVGDAGRAPRGPASNGSASNDAATGRGDLTWVPIGPRPITGEFWSGDDFATGRVVSIAPHPTDPDRVWIASASGGAWRTTDGGTSWTPLTDQLPTLNGGAITVDPANPDRIYYGTGEWTTSSSGAGVFRSLDGGDTWDVFAPSSIVGSRTSAVIVDPTNPNVVHVAGSGYHRTVDGGATWSSPLDGGVSSLVMDPINPQRLMAARSGDGIYRSTNGGASWIKLFGGLPPSGFSRIVLALAASNPDRVYATFASGGSVVGTWRTDTFGIGWTELIDTPPFAWPQAWYDMYLAVDPTDADTVFGGGVSPLYAEAGIIRSTDGGASWIEISAGTTGGSAQTHPDHHTMAFGPGGRIWEGNDGGVWRSDDGGDTWVNRNANLALTQLYTVGVSPHDGALVLGGTQDNGTVERLSEDQRWPQLIGGDGGFLAYDHADPAVKYSTYVYLSIQRWIDGSLQGISGPWQDDPREFIAPLAMDPVDPDTLYGGTNRLWRTTNASTDAVWEAVSDDTVSGGGVLTAIAPAHDDGRTVWTGSSNGRVWRLVDATWTNHSNGLPTTRLTDIVVSPEDPDVAYVARRRTSGSRLHRTVDGGASWSNLTGDLPAGYGITALAVDWRHAPPVLVAGTGAGIFCSVDDGTTWTPAGPEFPNVNVGDLAIDVDRATIVAGTYGRGAWRAHLPGPAAACPADVDASGAVDLGDLVAVLAAWGACPGGGAPCPADLDASGAVDLTDLVTILAAWGPCD